MNESLKIHTYNFLKNSRQSIVKSSAVQQEKNSRVGEERDVSQSEAPSAQETVQRLSRIKDKSGDMCKGVRLTKCWGFPFLKINLYR